MDSGTLTPADALAVKARTPFPGASDEYQKARQALLKDEIEFRRHMTRVAEQRRSLPDGPVIEKNYRFTDANGADLGLLELFGDKDTPGNLFLDVRAAARAPVSHVHKLAGCCEWKCR